MDVRDGIHETVIIKMAEGNSGTDIGNVFGTGGRIDIRADKRTVRNVQNIDIVR